MKKITLILCLNIAMLLQVFAGENNATTQYDSFLKKYVNAAGNVDYKGMSKDTSSLDEYLKYLAKVDVKPMSKNEKMALYINAYNAYTLKLILNHYPLESIKEISTSKRWTYTNWLVADTKLSLEDIEHKILRPMGDARIHFAINCASKSCPPLLNAAYNAEKLEEQLKQQTILFLNNETLGLAIKESSGFLGFSKSNRLFVSKIFKWYKKDFTDENGSLIKYIRHHGDEKLKKKIAKMSEDDIKYLSYDWSLNGK